jgi:hypothetical protein
MIADPQTDTIELEFSASLPFTAADRTVASIADGFSQVAATFRAAAPAQASPDAAVRAHDTASLLDELADEAWNLLGAGSTPGAQFALRELSRSTELVVDALRRGTSLDLVAEVIAAYFANLQSQLARLEVNAGRRLRAALAAFRASLSLVQLAVASYQRALQPNRRVGGRFEVGSADLYRNVHSLVAAALAPPAFLPNDDTTFVGRTVQPRAS